MTLGLRPLNLWTFRFAPGLTLFSNAGSLRVTWLSPGGRRKRLCGTPGCRSAVTATLQFSCWPLTNSAAALISHKQWCRLVLKLSFTQLILMDFNGETRNKNTQSLLCEEIKPELCIELFDYNQSKVYNRSNDETNVTYSFLKECRNTRSLPT